MYSSLNRVLLLSSWGVSSDTERRAHTAHAWLCLVTPTQSTKLTFILLRILRSKDLNTNISFVPANCVRKCPLHSQAGTVTTRYSPEPNSPASKRARPRFRVQRISTTSRKRHSPNLQKCWCSCRPICSPCIAATSTTTRPQALCSLGRSGASERRESSVRACKGHLSCTTPSSGR